MHGSCPEASRVLGESQNATADGPPRWELGIPRDGPPLPSGRLWATRENAEPCPLRMISTEPACEEPTCPMSVMLEGACPEVDLDHPGARDADAEDPALASDVHNPVIIVSDDPTGCRFVRPTSAEDPERALAALPAPVAEAAAGERARPHRTLEIKTTEVDGKPVVWQVSSLDFDAPTTDNGNSPENCPLPISVFVRTSGGVVQLDVDESVVAVLFDHSGPRVLLTGEYGLSSRGYDLLALPPHRPGVVSETVTSCIR